MSNAKDLINKYIAKIIDQLGQPLTTETNLKATDFLEEDFNNLDFTSYGTAEPLYAEYEWVGSKFYSLTLTVYFYPGPRFTFNLLVLNRNSNVSNRARKIVGYENLPELTDDQLNRAINTYFNNNN